jgi:hypothetical protein
MGLVTPLTIPYSPGFYIKTTKEGQKMADAIEDKVSNLWYWKNGNGSEGAAKKLEKVEDWIGCHEIDHATEKATREMQLKTIFNEAMNERAKSRAGKLRNWGPYFASIIGLLSAVAVAIINAILR